MRRLVFGTITAAAMLAFTVPMALAQDPMRVEHVHFAAGATGSAIEGRISGRESVVYRLGAEAGQLMAVTLTSNNTATYFNIYAPGSGPGDQALAVGSLTGDMMIDINRFSGVLPQSGEYAISVYLYRNAARRGETSDYTLDISITGATGAIVQGDFADGLQGGPDYWVVRTGGGTLNLRQSASSGARIVTKLANGTPLRNLGCRMAEARSWCRVATLSDPGFEGWAASDFLAEGNGEGVATQLPDMIPVPNGTGDAVVPGTGYHATGPIDCVRDKDAPSQTCTFGVVREGNGTGSVTIDWPDGGSQVIFFENGSPVAFDQSRANQGLEMTVTREGDNSIVFIGEERFVIPDAVIWGG